MANEKNQPSTQQPKQEPSEQSILAELKKQVEEGLSLLNQQRAELERDRKQLLEEAERLNSSLAEKLKGRQAMGIAERRAAELNEQLEAVAKRGKLKYKLRAFSVLCIGMESPVKILAIDESEAVRRAVICYGVEASKHRFRVDVES